MAEIDGMAEMLFRYLMNLDQQREFQRYIIMFDEFTKEIPLTFLLGFYVAMIVRRYDLLIERRQKEEIQLNLAVNPSQYFLTCVQNSKRITIENFLNEEMCS